MYSGREFFLDEIGIPIRNLAGKNAKITPRGIAVIEKHLSRFGFDFQNSAMIQRLKDILSGKTQMTQADINFYTHELREYVRYRKLGFETGLPADEIEQMRLWNNTHSATLEDYQLKEGKGVLYHPSTEPK